MKPSAKSRNAARPHFLLVEDRQDFGTALKKTLRRWGEVTWASNFVQAVASFTIQPFSAVIVDVRLEGPSGFEVLAAFRAIHPSTPVMVLTGYLVESDSVRACELRAQYVAKPITTAALQAFLESSLTPLSDRERDILARMIRGQTSKEIAVALGISESTVRVFVHRAKRKRSARSRSQLLDATAISRRSRQRL